jgi:hypothetical protein
MNAKILRQICTGALLLAAETAVLGADQEEQRPTLTEEPRLTNSPPLPPPGRLIDLGGWRLHLNCTGTRRASRPTVILEAGAGDFSVDWSLVQPGIAAFARVCSYDRAGLKAKPETQNPS